MKFNIIIGTLIAICWHYNVNAQEKDLVLNSKFNSDKSLSIVADKSKFGTYTVVLELRELTNTNTSIRSSYTVENSNITLETFTPTNKDQSISASYSYTYIKGKLKPKFDPLFLYIIPYKNGKNVHVSEASFLNAKYFGSSTPDDWKSYFFATEQSDTVVAARKGLVIGVEDSFDSDLTDVQYTSKQNIVTIEHQDGTIATYRGFKKGIFVKEGQTVFPGTALGMSGKLNNRYSISLLLSYLKSIDFKAQKMKNSKSLYGFITPYFATQEYPNRILQNQQKYIAIITQDIIKKEMTKKELKAITNP